MKKNVDNFAGDKVQELKDVLGGNKTVSDSSENDLSSGEALPSGDVQDFLDKIKTLEEELAKAQEMATLQKEQALRMMAEFENSKKRMQREKEEMTKYSNEKILNELFPILDNLEMTVFHGKTGKGDAKDPFIEGVAMVIKQFVSVLDKYGVEVVSGEGLPFNPHVQEAIGYEDSDCIPPGNVVTVHRKGYLLNKRLVRPASVTVAKEAGEEPTVH
ncbi:nucleotide exchange factor GrpE [bacterium]|nr:nucleotide exchange factor GrpE [bacterium]